MNLIAYFFPKLQTAKDVVRQISKKSRFRTPFDNQHAKETQTLLEYSRQHFYQIFPSLYWKLSFKVSLLVICDSLGVLLKHWRSMTSIFFVIVTICCNQFKSNYLKNEKCFLNFLQYF